MDNKEITVKKVYARLLKLEGKIDAIDERNLLFLNASVKQFRFISLTALVLVTVNISLTIAVLYLVARL